MNRKRVWSTGIMAALSLGIFTSQGVVVSADSEAWKTAYGNVLWQYYDVWNTEGVSMEMYDDKNSIVNYVVYFGPFSDEANLAFSVTDLDGNQVPELVIGHTYVSEESEFFNVFDVFTYADGQVVQLFRAGERSGLTMCRDGIISENGSGGAAYNYQWYYVINPDGKSANIIAYYYINGSDMTVENIDGYESVFDGDYEKYLNQYEPMELSWNVLTEGMITGETVDRETAGEPFTPYDITVAPIFKKGVCQNGYEVFSNQYLKRVGSEEYNKYLVIGDYQETDQETDILYIRDPQTNDTLITEVVDLRTGEVTETKADGTEERYFIFEKR